MVINKFSVIYDSNALITMKCSFIKDTDIHKYVNGSKAIA